MIYLITEHGYDPMETIRNDIYESVLGYVETPEEAEKFIAVREKMFPEKKKILDKEYPYYSIKPLSKL